MRHQTAEEVRFGQILPVALCELLAAVDAAREYLHVGEDKLEVNRDNIVRRVERSGNVDDVFVLKAAHDMDDGVHLANVCQKLVAKPLAPGRAAHEPGDIHELNDGGRVLFGVVHLRQHVEPFVRHGDDAHVRVDGAERVVRGLGRGACDRVEKRAFADVRQANNAHLHELLLRFPAQVSQRLARVGGGKHRRSRDDDVCPIPGNRGDVLFFHAAVYFYIAGIVIFVNDAA